MTVESNPWSMFAKKHQRKERIKAPISRIQDFGIFVLLEGRIEGIIHVGDLSWTEPGDEVIKRYSAGDMVETIILNIEPERERICLSIKHLSQKPDPDNPGGPVDPHPVEPTPKPPNNPLKNDAASGAY